jgi:hypothetical protein
MCHRVLNNIELLSPESRSKFLNEVSSLSGRNYIKVKISKVDYKKGISEPEIVFKEMI